MDWTIWFWLGVLGWLVLLYLATVTAAAFTVWIILIGIKQIKEARKRRRE